MSSALLSLSRSVQELTEENQSLKEDLDRVLSDSPTVSKIKGTCSPEPPRGEAGVGTPGGAPGCGRLRPQGSRGPPSPAHPGAALLQGVFQSGGSLLSARCRSRHRARAVKALLLRREASRSDAGQVVRARVRGPRAAPKGTEPPSVPARLRPGAQPAYTLAMDTEVRAGENRALQATQGTEGWSRGGRVCLASRGPPAPVLSGRRVGKGLAGAAGGLAQVAQQWREVAGLRCTWGVGAACERHGGPGY